MLREKMKIICHAVLLYYAQAYNINTTAIVIENPVGAQSSNLFGYAFATSQSDILIGAPKYENHGTVYNCTIENQQCSEFLDDGFVSLHKVNNQIDQNGYIGATVERNGNTAIICEPYFGKVTSKNDQWLGRCFKISGTETTQISHEGIKGTEPDMLGLGGVIMTDELNVFSIVQKYQRQGGLMVIPKACDSCEQRSAKLDYFAKDLRNATEVKEFSEMIDNYKFVDDKCKFHNQCNKVESLAKDMFKNFQLNNYDTTLGGSSMASIDLDGDSSTTGDFGILIGAPLQFRQELTGRVLAYGLNGEPETIFDKSNKEQFNGKSFFAYDFYLDSSGFEDGSQFGEQFGHSLAVGDFNGDGLMDIAVGAPTWFKHTETMLRVNVGRVYIFIQTPKETGGHGFRNDIADTFIPTISLTGKDQNGQFGKVVVCNGDLDNDGYDDLVISAPFMNNQQGEVYIYNGGPTNGLQSTEPSQTLRETDSVWFGYSVKFQNDFDGNGYNDLVVSSPKSETVFVYKTRPSINVKVHMLVPDKPISSKNFACKHNEYKLCLNVEICGKFSGKGLPKMLNGTMRLELDVNAENKRLYRLGTDHSNYILFSDWNNMQKGKESCETVALQVDWDYGIDKVSPIVMNCSLNIDIPDMPMSPISNMYSANTVVKSVDLWKDCGEDNICNTDFDLSLATLNKSLAVKESEKIEFDVLFEIMGEHSYGTLLIIESSRLLGNGTSTDFIGIGNDPFDCDHYSDKLDDYVLDICRFPQNPTSPQRFNLTCRFTVVPDGVNDEIEFRFSFNNTNTIGSRIYKSILFPVSIKSKIMSFAKQSSLEFLNNTDMADEDMTFETSFEFVNKGPADVKESRLVISIPVYAPNGDQIIQNIEELKPKVTPSLLMKLIPEQGKWEECFISNAEEIRQKRIQRQKYPNQDEVETVMDTGVFACEGESSICAVYMCNIGMYTTEVETLAVTIDMVIDRDFAQDMSKHQQFSLTSTCDLQIKSFPYLIKPEIGQLKTVSRASTLVVDIIVPIQDSVPLWVIILAALGAILLVALISVICWRCGVFGDPDATDTDGNVDYHQATIVKSANRPKAQTMRVSETDTNY